MPAVISNTKQTQIAAETQQTSPWSHLQKTYSRNGDVEHTSFTQVLQVSKASSKSEDIETRHLSAQVAIHDSQTHIHISIHLQSAHMIELLNLLLLQLKGSKLCCYFRRRRIKLSTQHNTVSSLLRRHGVTLLFLGKHQQMLSYTGSSPWLLPRCALSVCGLSK